MIYIGLLRGINVGGNHKVDMKRLKAVLAQEGYESLVTYINSGNLVFRSDKVVDVIEYEIHHAILREFGVKSRVLVINQVIFQEIVQAIPDHFINNQDTKADVVFYYRDIDQDAISDLKFREAYDSVVYLEHALIHCIAKKHATRSGLAKIIGSKIYSSITVRNVNTVRKLNLIIETFV